MLDTYKRYKFFDSQVVAPKSVTESSEPGLKRVVNTMLNKLLQRALSSLMGV